MKRKEYNNGFKQYYYKCQYCGCESISQKHLGGFQPPVLSCDCCNMRVIDNPIVLYYEDNCGCQNIEQTYSEKEVEKLVYDAFLVAYKSMNDFLLYKTPMIDESGWFEENKNKMLFK